MDRLESPTTHVDILLGEPNEIGGNVLRLITMRDASFTASISRCSVSGTSKSAPSRGTAQ